MPTYEYECLKCRYEFDKFQGMSDARLKKCPKCKGKVKRLIGRGSGIIFKGSGFYETDYKRKSGGSGEAKSAKPAPVAKPESSPADSKGSKTKASGKKKE